MRILVIVIFLKLFSFSFFKNGVSALWPAAQGFSGLGTWAVAMATIGGGGGVGGVGVCGGCRALTGVVVWAAW